MQRFGGMAALEVVHEIGVLVATYGSVGPRIYRLVER